MRLQRRETGFAELAAVLGRSEAAVRRKRQRLHSGSRAARWTLERLARRAGYDRTVVKRVANELGIRWSTNGRGGNGARHWLSSADAAEVLQRLGGGKRWSRHGDKCRRCGQTDRPHYARGLCGRCYQRRRVEEEVNE